MQQHYALDHLVEYGTEPLPETVRVVNPAWRELNGKVNRLRGPMLRLHAQFGAASVPMKGTPQEVSAHEREQGEVLRTVQERASEMAALKEQRRKTLKHVNLSELPLEQRFTQLRLARKQLVDTIKMTAYRAETALVQIVREKLARGDDARAWVRGLMNGMADLQPDLEKGTLTRWLHPHTCQAHETVLKHVCEELTATETEFSGNLVTDGFQTARTKQNPVHSDSTGSGCLSLQMRPVPGGHRVESEATRGEA